MTMFGTALRSTSLKGFAFTDLDVRAWLIDVEATVGFYPRVIRLPRHTWQRIVPCLTDLTRTPDGLLIGEINVLFAPHAGEEKSVVFVP